MHTIYNLLFSFLALFLCHIIQTQCMHFIHPLLNLNFESVVCLLEIMFSLKTSLVTKNSAFCEYVPNIIIIGSVMLEPFIAFYDLKFLKFVEETILSRI